MFVKEISEKLTQSGLRVTPQRVAILKSIYTLNNHPTAEDIAKHLKKNNPNISVATIYKVLDSLVEVGLLDKVKTEDGKMRFDPTINKHHHLYCAQTDRIEDYVDEDLDKLIKNYFKKRKINNFNLEDFSIQLTGTFNTKK